MPDLVNSQRLRLLRELVRLPAAKFAGSIEEVFKLERIWHLEIGWDDDWLADLASRNGIDPNA